MQFVRLYGKGAAAFHYGKDVIRSANGHVDVPAMLVPAALAMGFTREQTGPDEEEVAKIATPEAVALVGAGDIAKIVAAVDVGVRRVQYAEEARASGYDAHAVDEIVAERLRFDELVAGGMSEQDAAAQVWGPTPGVDALPLVGAGTLELGDPAETVAKVIVDADIEAAKIAGDDARIAKAD